VESGARCVVLDAPTLFEAGADRLCRRIISVLAKADVRLNRIMQRDGITQEEAQRRMRAQQNDAFYADRSDFVLDNTDFIPESAVTELLTALGL